MKVEYIKNCWVIVDESSMILAVMDSVESNIKQHYKDTCNKIKSGDYEIVVEDIDDAQTALIPDFVASIRIFTNVDKTREAFEEVLIFLRGEADET